MAGCFVLCPLSFGLGVSALRDHAGRFGPGNKFGKGRPRRSIETEYIAALSDTVSLEDWRGVCRKALEKALSGDHRAREWLTRYLIGAEPPSLVSLAAMEANADGLDAAAEKQVGRESTDQLFLSAFDAMGDI